MNSEELGIYKEFSNNAMIISNGFGVPPELYKTYTQGATFENQEKARGAHVSYTLSPAAELLCSEVNKRFGYTLKSLLMDWEHLPFMQVFAKDRAETRYKNAQTLQILMKCGVKLEEINSILDENFTELDYEAAQRSTTEATGSSQQGTGSANQGGD